MAEINRRWEEIKHRKPSSRSVNLIASIDTSTLSPYARLSYEDCLAEMLVREIKGRRRRCWDDNPGCEWLTVKSSDNKPDLIKKLKRDDAFLYALEAQ